MYTLMSRSNLSFVWENLYGPVTSTSKNYFYLWFITYTCFYHEITLTHISSGQDERAVTYTCVVMMPDSYTRWHGCIYLCYMS